MVSGVRRMNEVNARRVDHGSGPSAGRVGSGHVVRNLKKLYIYRI